MIGNESPGSTPKEKRQSSTVPSSTRWQRAFEFWEKQKALHSAAVPITLIHDFADLIVHSFKVPFVPLSVVHTSKMLALVRQLNSRVSDDFRHHATDSISLIIRIENLVLNSLQIPWMAYSVVDENRMLDLIEELESTFLRECGIAYISANSGSDLVLVSSTSDEVWREPPEKEALDVAEISQIRALISDINRNLGRIEKCSNDVVAKIESIQEDIR